MTTVLGKPVPQVEVALVSAHHIGADSPPVWSSQVFLVLLVVHPCVIHSF